MSDPVLAVEGLSVSFRGPSGWNQVVRDIGFEIGTAETLAVVGESGSGKSVTAMAVMRLLSARNAQVRGRIRLAGRDLQALPEAEMCKVRGGDVAMIFQEPMTSLNPVRTIGFQLAEALMLHRNLSRREADAEALQLLERVRIPSAKSRMKAYPHLFSGGMRQRVMIAMALACRPKLLIADEPTTALDVTIQAQILELIRDIQAEFGTSVLFITHDLGVVVDVAHRTLVMCQGEQIEVGTTTEIFARPRQPYTRRLLAAVPRLGAMQGHARPLLFPPVDPETGIVGSPCEIPPTVADEAVPALEVRNLVTRYAIGKGLFSRQLGAIHAVENVSFRIQPGETLALVGESGCGKSTIGRTIMRLQAPTSGDILFDGRNSRDAAPKELFSRIQMVFQDPFSSLNPRLTVGASIAAPMQINGIASGAAARVRVGELLTRVGLDPTVMHRYPQEFSGGQRQRICIARSLALTPSVMIADEAVSALDVSIKAQIVNLMLDLQQSMKLAYLFISHDMAVVERVSHRVAVMYMGEIVEIGPRAAVLYDPRHAYTRRLLEAVPVADPAAPRRRTGLDASELRSPVHLAGFVPPLRHYTEVSPGHFVMDPA